MDLEEVKACLRALLSSTAFAYNLNRLLTDFRNMTGMDLPLFGCLNPLEFLKTLDDTVQLLGNPFDPEIALIESKKSSHIASLVDRQKVKSLKNKYPHSLFKNRRLIIPNKDEVNMNSKKNEFQCSNPSSFRNSRQANSLKPPLKSENALDNQMKTKLVSHPPSTGDNMKNQPVGSPIKVNKILPEDESFNNEKKVQVERSEVESSEVEKTDSCYFEDVSESESCLSVDGSRSSSSQAMSSSCSSVSDGIKNKLKQLMKRFPEGLWCCELPELFLEEFHFVLDYREFGYTSLIQMLSELPDVFRCIRPGNEDWILFDASIPPSPKEKKMMVLQSTAETNGKVKTNLQKLVFNHLKDSSDSGIELSKIPDLYQKMFGCSLDVESLGFQDVKSLLESWEGSSLHMLKINGNFFVVPALKLSGQLPFRWEEAVPPVTAENDLFLEIFPKDVVGPEENLAELDLYRHVAVGQVVEVCVAEVWSPSKFYLQLNKFRNRLNRFMDELQRFYNIHLKKYKMPDSTIRPNQVCVGLYSSDPELPDEWHRAQVVKVINEKMVLINFVDFGTVTRVKKTQLRFLHRNFQYFPVQAFLAELSDVIPPNDEKIWPTSTSRKFLEHLRLPYFKAEIVEIDFKKPAMSVILFDPFQPNKNINENLIKEKLAWKKEPVTDDPFIFTEPKEDILEKSNPPENDTKPLTDNSSSVQESFNKNLPDEFSDFTDLGHPTLFYFRMKSLKLDNASSSKEKNSPKKTAENLNYTFDEVPDLEKSNEDEGDDRAKANTKNGVSEDKKNPLKFTPLFPVRQERFNSPQPIRNSNIKPSSLPSNTRLPKTTPQEASLPSKSNTLPPGLEHLNVLSSLPETLLLMHKENIKKRVNVVAMELLAKNASIQQVGMSDPALALKIATEMAEAFVTSEYSSQFPPGVSQLFASCLATQSPTVTPEFVAEPGTNPGFELPDIMSSSQDTPQLSPSKANSETVKDTKQIVKKMQINGKNIHLVILDNQMYFCAEEIVRAFTLISNREIADRVLKIKKINIEYRVLSKKTDGEALKIIKSSGLEVVKKKSKKSKIYLLSIERVVPFLQALGCRVKSFENELIELKKQEPDAKKVDRF